MNVESSFSDLIGPAAGRLHTARSRNDQVATDFRLFVRDTIDVTDAALAAFQHALVERALEHAGTVMPGFTHLQTAQPVTFGHHLLAYIEMAARDRGRNPDAAELVRAKTGRVIGALTGLLIVMKGLPLAYQKDMQEDKQGAMEAFGALSLAIRAMTGMVIDLVPDEARMEAAAGEGYATATDLADWLVRTLKVPFRDAPHATGPNVAEAWKDGVPLHQLPLKEMQAIEPKITAEALGVLSVEASVKSRTSYGGTAPKNVLAQAKSWLKRLAKERKMG